MCNVIKNKHLFNDPYIWYLILSMNMYCVCIIQGLHYLSGQICVREYVCVCICVHVFAVGSSPGHRHKQIPDVLLFYVFYPSTSFHHLLSVCSPPVVRNAKTTENRTSYLAGERAEMVCKDGYRVPFTRSSVLHLICTDDGSWQNYVSETDIPTCESKKCSVLL